MTCRHPFHIVDPSPWPILTAFSALFLTFGGVIYMHLYKGGGFLLSLGLILVIFSAGFWWRDVVREATFEGHHTRAVQQGLSMGIILFIVSEVMFFFAFFWAFFHSSLVPGIGIGGVWPPEAIPLLESRKLPLLNTFLLLSSGFVLNFALEALKLGHRNLSLAALELTIFLALVFTCVQYNEYLSAGFGISDGIYGSLFYILTGFHGFHVIIGTLFLLVGWARHYSHHFTQECHLGLVFAAWYWHFVDVVWIFLYLVIYEWGSWVC